MNHVKCEGGDAPITAFGRSDILNIRPGHSGIKTDFIGTTALNTCVGLVFLLKNEDSPNDTRCMLVHWNVDYCSVNFSSPLAYHNQISCEQIIQRIDDDLKIKRLRNYSAEKLIILGGTSDDSEKTNERIQMGFRELQSIQYMLPINERSLIPNDIQYINSICLNDVGSNIVNYITSGLDIAFNVQLQRILMDLRVNETDIVFFEIDLNQNCICAGFYMAKMKKIILNGNLKKIEYVLKLLRNLNGFKTSFRHITTIWNHEL
ncbi:unnamed protein product [Didymodactylos carnosus]|uniref:Uncharacterized protein n=1 Tax=Didymodactylos carnosus TaxID=1234261 RepID=A0A815UU14_9BILA|nr:unnamed protein product [Didymodactylos carnosus]CAF4378244.1 unnamed protein product [Didymodactylos carnosus]